MNDFITFILFVAFYAYISYSLQTICDRLRVENSWLAWVPIANAYVMCLAADKPGWWVILFFIPFVNVVVGILVWVEICKKLGKSPWLLLLFLVPLLNLALIGYLAFS
ncbi:MAG TPA: DUF5684 domain-containing protein [Candidatus Obscuribacterales bacterium]